MKLIGPWFSGYTRRVGVTLNLLGISFEHLPNHAYEQQELIRPFSPMVKVPALVRGCPVFCVNGFLFNPAISGLRTGWRSGLVRPSSL